MNHVERFRKVMAFEPVDRRPMIEWAGWWDKTLARWRNEGLPENLANAGEIREYLGLDCYRQLWVRATDPNCPGPESYGSGIIRNMDDYLGIRPYLYPEQDFSTGPLPEWERCHQTGDMVVWMSLEGYFWFPRRLLGIENHLYAFYEPAGTHAPDQFRPLRIQSPCH